MTICHATGSETNPYVEITIARPAVTAHARHQDGRDIIPAPAGGCPKAATTEPLPSTSGPTPGTGTDAGTGTPASDEAPATTAASGQPATTGTVGVAGVSDTATGTPAGIAPAAAGTTGPLAVAGAQDAVPGSVGVLGAADSTDGGPAVAQPTAAVDAPGGLPFTGLKLMLVLMAGGALLLTGLGIRMAMRSRTAQEPGA